MTARFFRSALARTLAFGLLACLPTRLLAAPSTPARKVPRKPPAKADFPSTFSAAVRLYEAFDYEKALEEFTRAQALAQGPEQEVPVALYLGIVQAELGDREQSLTAFRTGLYLQPDAKLPVKVSPRVERDFEEVRQAVLKDLAPARTAPESTGDRPVQSPADKPVLTPAPAPPPPAYAQTDAARARPSVLPLALLGTGAVAGGAATFFGLQAASTIRSAGNSSVYGERLAKLDRADDQALVANILFGTASAAAVGALAVYFFGGSAPAPAPPSTGGASP